MPCQPLLQALGRSRRSTKSDHSPTLLLPTCLYLSLPIEHDFRLMCLENQALHAEKSRRGRGREVDPAG